MNRFRSDTLYELEMARFKLSLHESRYRPSFTSKSLSKDGVDREMSSSCNSICDTLISASGRAIHTPPPGNNKLLIEKSGIRMRQGL